jgi:hypothetical protein
MLLIISESGLRVGERATNLQQQINLIDCSEETVKFMKILKHLIYTGLISLYLFFAEDKCLCSTY